MKVLIKEMHMHYNVYKGVKRIKTKLNLTKTLIGLVALALPAVMFLSTGVALAAPSTCATIKGGTITDSAGNPLVLGYDQWGYNYQAHMFNGTYDSSDRVLDGTYWGSTGDYVDDSLIMKWSDAWLSNKDCNGNGKLDRGLDVGANISQGWLTNQIVGDYTDVDGNLQHYTYFSKIVWTGPGSPLWGQYTLVQEVYNDPAGGFNGLQSKIGAPGFGLNDQRTAL